MKKIILILVSALLIFSSISCAEDTTQQTTLQTTEEVTTNMYDNYEEYSLAYGSDALFEKTLIPVQTQDELWGYINEEGVMVIEAKYDFAESFNDAGYADVYLNDSPNVINMLGEELLTGDYDLIEQHDHYILGMKSWIGTASAYYAYDYEGNILVDNVLTFEEIAEAYPDDPRTNWTRVEVDEEYFIYDEDGVKVNENSYDDFFSSAYQEDISVIIKGELYGFLGESRDSLIEPIYKNRILFGTYFMNSDIGKLITEDDLLGFVDRFGEILIEPIYDVSSYEGLDDYEVLFNHGVQMVPDGDTQYIIDLEGNILFELPDDASTIGEYDDQVVELIYWDDIDVPLDYQSTLVDYDKNVLCEVTGKSIYLTYDESDVYFIGGVTMGIPGMGVTMYDYQGNILKDNISMVYTSFERMHQHLNFVNGYMDYIDRTTGTIGFMDLTGTTFIEPQFEVDSDTYKNMKTLIFHNDGYAVVMKDGLYGIIDKEGNVIVDYQFLTIFEEYSFRY